MQSAALYLCVFIVTAAREIVDYQFWTAQTQGFYDYSHSDNHGVNGRSSATEVGTDAVLSLAGAEFTIHQRVTLPPNDLVSRSLAVGPNFSMLFWVNFVQKSLAALAEKLDSGGSVVLFGVYMDQNRVSVEVMGNKYTFPISFVSGDWVMVTVATACTSTCSVTVFKNSGSPYQRTGYPLFQDSVNVPFVLGDSGPRHSYEGTISEFRLFDTSLSAWDLSGYYGSASACAPCSTVCALKSPLAAGHCLTSGTAGTGLDSCSDLAKCGTADCVKFASTQCFAVDAPKCHMTCYTCFGPNDTDCDSCRYSEDTLSYGKCQCPSDAYYRDPVTYKCTQCHPNCAKCVDASICPPCPSKSHESSGSCVCDPGYYQTPSYSCDDCDPTCGTCAGAGASMCSTCASLSAALAGPAPSSCVCGNGFYPNTTSANCTTCDPTCSSCSSASSCTLCKSNATVVPASPGTCQCNSGFYGSPDARNCVACHSTCKTCSGGKQSECMQCFSDATLSSTAPSACLCNPGLTPPPTDCTTCHPTCAKCIGSSASDCTECRPGAVLAGVSPALCGCVSQFYPNTDAGNCVPCHPACKDCADGSLNKCTSCKSPATLAGSAPNTCECPGGKYMDTTTGTCENCDLTCKTCTISGASGCSSCDLGMQLSGPLPSPCVCASGYYADPLPPHCSPCDATCESCAGASTPCTSCKPHGTVSPSGTCVCVSGYFPSPTPATCSQCSPSCRECASSSPSSCTACFAHAKIASGSSGPCACEDGFYLSGSLCAQCDGTCRTCAGAGGSQCTGCYPGASLQTPPVSSCVCSSGSFFNLSTLSCEPCAAHCVSCVSSDSLSCTGCQSSYKLSGTAPAKCISAITCAPTCQTCVGTGAAECTSCVGTMVLAGSAPSNCQCPAGFYQSATGCDRCHSLCLTCGGGGKDSCGMCRANMRLVSTAPSACVCVDGHYLSSDQLSCEQCPRLCTTCSSATSCSSCQLNCSIVSGACQCNPGYFPSGETCASCDPSCATCVNSQSSGCLTCKTGAVLATTSAPATCICRNGYVLDTTTKSCNRSLCDIGCISCSASGVCGGCFKFAELVQNKCQCKAGFYPNPDSANCSICDSRCVTCLDGTNLGCTSCPSNTTLSQPGSTKSTCVCMDGLFPDPDITKCSKCADGCRTCSKQDVCDSCPNGYKLTLVQRCKECSNCDSPLIAFATGPIDTDYNVTFNRFVPKNFTTEDFLLSTVPESNVTWELISMPTIRIYGGPWANITSVLIKFVTVVVDEFGVRLNNTELLVPPPTDPPSSHNDSFVNSTVATAATVVAGVIGGGAVVAGATAGGGNLAMALLSQMQYFSYIGTANYSMTGSMNNFYVNLNQKSTLPNVFKRSNSNPAARRLSDVEELIVVEDFLDSSGQYLTLFAGIVALHVLFFLLNRVLGQRFRCLQRLANMFRYSVYLHFWYFSFLDLQVSALLQLKSTGFSAETMRLIVCEVVAFGVLCCTFATPIILFFFIRNKSEQLFDSNENIWKQRFSPTVASLRTDVKWAKYLVPLYYFQRLLYSLFIVYMRGQQLKQALLLIIPCGLMVVFVILLRPMLLKTNRVLHIIAEVDTVIVYILLCFATLQYNSPQIDLCWIIVGFTLKSFLCTVAMVLIEVIVGMCECCRKRRMAPSQVYAITTESIAGPDFKTAMWADQTEISFGEPTKYDQKKIYPFMGASDPRASSTDTRRSDQSLT